MKSALALSSLVTLSLGCGAAAAPAPPPPPSTVATVAASASPAKPPAPAAPTPLGELDFSVTGAPECQRLFRDGMLAMHSFEYDQAHQSFVAALAADPACAMAAWGDAMTYEHPIWHERDLPKARAALAKVTREDALTPKERAYLAAARELFAKDDSKEAHAAWLAAATKMHAEYTNDDEVALQHTLALLSVYGYEPKHVREQMEAGAIALEVLQRRPEHPGAAHYVIHSFDSREHAILALAAARTYARIAPAAGHAQHMPSHTFVHLGMWRDVVPSNEKGYASSVAWEKSRGHSPSTYDWHSYSWLVAAHLELGQHTRAKLLVDDVRALVVAAKDDSAGMRVSFTDIVADYVVVTGRWSEVEALVAPVFAAMPDEGSDAAHVACAAHAPAAGGEVRMPYALFARLFANVLRAEAAIRAGDKDTAEKRIADLKAVRAQMAPWAKSLAPSFSKRWDAIDEMLGARARAGAKPTADATKKVLAAIEHLVKLEEERPISGPAFLETPRELMANALVAAGRPKDALVHFDKDLDQRPNRAVALLGAARAAKAAGDAATARARYAALADLWRDADPTLAALAEVRDGAK